MVEVYEIIAGTTFLIPLVISLIGLCAPIEHIIPVIAALALPVGWLIINFQRFIFTFRGRYEHYPTLEHIRKFVNVTKNKDYVVDLSNVLADVFQARKLTLNEEEYERVFDPYKVMAKRRTLFWKSYRSKQPDKFKEKYGENVLKPYFVENIENLFFFKTEGLAKFIMVAHSVYHTSRAALYGILLGGVFSIGLVLCFWPQFLPLMTYLSLLNLILNRSITIPILEIIRVTSGIFLMLLPTYLMAWATEIQSVIRKNESQANEELLIRLKIATYTQKN